MAVQQRSASRITCYVYGIMYTHWFDRMSYNSKAMGSIPATLSIQFERTGFNVFSRLETATPSFILYGCLLYE